MLSATTLLADALGRRLVATYRNIFGSHETRWTAIVDGAARLVTERIGNSDALYHDATHTVLVTLVGQDILRGRLMKRIVTPEDWGHLTLALLTHDVGYMRGVCPGDTRDRFVTDEAGATVEPPRGASDAWFAPYHVDRSKIFVRERFRDDPQIDAERIARAIELTRFPVPDDDDHAETDTEAGLVRAADLIGQLADPLYLKKLNALYFEFSEIGANERLGYTSPADLVEHYPSFYWTRVEPYVRDALGYLELTMEGKQWIANLYSHVFAVEKRLPRLGPHSGGQAPAGATAAAPADAATPDPQEQRGGPQPLPGRRRHLERR